MTQCVKYFFTVYPTGPSVIAQGMGKLEAMRTAAPIRMRPVLMTALSMILGVTPAALGIGPDSGPGHVSAAVKTPFVTLFGPTSPQRTAPFGSEQLVVTAEADCAPCYKKRCTDQNRQCMKSIHPEAVMEKVSLVLAGIKKDSRQ